ncbi:MAG TPA: hypothetical protein VG074_15090 [Acidimicrobiales bacterium]|jgi:hypothetical protein|nr:hypothetical protein [Acidimicrobiales bacterium]
MPVWGFIFALAAAIVFLVAFIQAKSLVAFGLCLLSVGFILTYATTAGLVHF